MEAGLVRGMRSREFLCQEGHTAFATKEEADSEVLELLELYRRIYEEYLAVPVVKGKKSELEKFPGALYTTTLEAFIPTSGHGIQGATVNCLGQEFAKAFEINFQDETGKKRMVWQNSWSYSTRTIGVMVMVHGDDRGLVLPPKVAPFQVIVVPVPCKDDTQVILDACSNAVSTLTEAGLRAEADLRDNHPPGLKYSYWEMRGVPLMITIGATELANDQGVPLQSGTKDCGLFIMRYMKEICLDKELKFVSKWLRRGSLSYGVDDLNEIRIEWAKYFMKQETS